jgi:hypothetical protein
MTFDNITSRKASILRSDVCTPKAMISLSKINKESDNSSSDSVENFSPKIINEDEYLGNWSSTFHLKKITKVDYIKNNRKKVKSKQNSSNQLNPK